MVSSANLPRARGHLPPHESAVDHDKAIIAGQTFAISVGFGDPSSHQKSSLRVISDPAPPPVQVVSGAKKRCPEQGRAEIQAAIDEEYKKLQACYDRLKSSHAAVDRRRKVLKDGNQALDEARACLKELNRKCGECFETRKKVMVELRDLTGKNAIGCRERPSKLHDLAGLGKAGKEALYNVHTVDGLEARISDLLYVLETKHTPLSKKKRIISKISFLENKGREFIRRREISSGAKQSAARVHTTGAKTRRELKHALSKCDVLINSAVKERNDQRRVVKKLRSERQTEIRRMQAESVHVSWAEEKKTIREIKATIIELRETRRRAARTGQMQPRDPGPCQQLKLCSSLTVYLKALLGGDDSKKSSVAKPLLESKPGPGLTSTPATCTVPTGCKKIGKASVSDGNGCESLLFSEFIGKKLKKKRVRQSSSTFAMCSNDEAWDTCLRAHPIDHLAAFTALYIKPPTKLREVPATLRQVEEKAADFSATLKAAQ